MFIDNLAHLCMLRMKDIWSKVENDIEHAGLCREGRAAVLWQWVGRDLVVDVIRAEPPYHHADEVFPYWDATGTEHRQVISE